MFEFDDIRPYTDEEAVAVLEKLSHNPFLPIVSKFLFPDEPFYYFRKMLLEVHSISDFQELVMTKLVSAVVDRSSSGFSYEGLEYLDKSKVFLAVSNHRDITLDPALVQWTLFNNDMPMTEICVGSNLLTGSKLVADLLLSNRMIKVIRGISARQLYSSSRLLSAYIREALTNSRCSIWIAQKEGRTKNGLDATETALLKMLDMSGTTNFKTNFEQLNIVPMSISYEYEPCDARKARELLLSQSGSYTKRRKEDTHSIITGIRQWKGGIHLSVDKPLTECEIELASVCDKKDRYQTIRKILDRRIISGYKLWKTNYMGYDLMTGGTKYSSLYSHEDLESFKLYAEAKLSRLEKKLNREKLKQLFWQIYGNPVLSKEKL